VKISACLNVDDSGHVPCGCVQKLEVLLTSYYSRELLLMELGPRFDLTLFATRPEGFTQVNNDEIELAPELCTRTS
jgi:hypothetical protein